MSIISYSYNSAALELIRKQNRINEQLLKSVSLPDYSGYMKTMDSPLYKAIAEQREQINKILEPFRTQQRQLHESLRPLQETLSAYRSFSENLSGTTRINETLNMLHSEIYDSFKLPETLQLVSSKWKDLKYDFNLPKLDLFIDTSTNTFTDYTAAMALDLSVLDIDDFDYSIDEDGFVHLSEPLETVVTNVFDAAETSVPKEKLFSREFFYNFIFPLLIMIIPLVFSIVQDNQQTKLQKEQHQEQMAIYHEILSEKEQQTGIAEKILEQEQQQTEYLKTIAEKDD